MKNTSTSTTKPAGVEVEDIDDSKILIFLGKSEKIPTETIRKTQPMGDRVEWITISGQAATPWIFTSHTTLQGTTQTRRRATT